MTKTTTVVAKHHLGQNFLKDIFVLEQIYQTLAPKPGQNVLEIGAGTGALTRLLEQSGAHLTVVEIDGDLVQKLKSLWPDLHILHADVLQLNLGSLLADRKWRLVGNLPYNISTPLLARLPAVRQQMVDGLFMLQEEVALRLAASTGSKQWGRLSVLLQHCFDVEPLFTVPPEAFSPKPAVQSRLIYTRPKAKPAAIQDYDLFLQLLQVVFGQRRKMIGNTLKSLTPALSADKLTELLTEIGINRRDRAEFISVDAFVQLTNALHRCGIRSQIKV